MESDTQSPWPWSHSSPGLDNVKIAETLSYYQAPVRQVTCACVCPVEDNDKEERKGFLSYDTLLSQKGLSVQSVILLPPSRKPFMSKALGAGDNLLSCVSQSYPGSLQVLYHSNLCALGPVTEP